MAYKINKLEREKRIKEELYKLKKSQDRLEKEREKRIKIQKGEMWYQKFI
jgi:hypothetical protein